MAVTFSIHITRIALELVQFNLNSYNLGVSHYRQKLLKGYQRYHCQKEIYCSVRFCDMKAEKARAVEPDETAVARQPISEVQQRIFRKWCFLYPPFLGYVG
jgi:hypothetical protein